MKNVSDDITLPSQNKDPPVTMFLHQQSAFSVFKLNLPQLYQENICQIFCVCTLAAGRHVRNGKREPRMFV